MQDKPKWTKLNVSQETAEAVRAECRRLADAAKDGETSGAGFDPDAINPACPGVSADALIRFLLAFHKRYRERRATAQKKKRRSRRRMTEGDGDP